MERKIGIGMVGCGYVADYYMNTLAYHPALHLVGVYDRRQERAKQFADFYQLCAFDSLEAMCADEHIEIIVNLTNPSSHFVVSKAALEAGKHVYSEKPLAMCYEEAKALVALANQRGLMITAAPCSLLGEAAQTLWKALREESIGQVYLVYAELDDGLVPQMNYRKWITPSGSPWPYEDEFQSGCTIEHAGYYLSWLTAFFGPAKQVTSFASCLIPGKGSNGIATGSAAASVPAPAPVTTPDFSVGCIEFASGVIARLTCSIVAEHNHQLLIVGEQGSLSMHECWDYRSPIYREKTLLKRRIETLPVVSRWFGYGKRMIPPVHNPVAKRNGAGSLKMMDYCRGIAELAASITEKRPCRLSAEHALHITEIVLTLQHPERMGTPRQIESTFTPLEPMPWAC